VNYYRFYEVVGDRFAYCHDFSATGDDAALREVDSLGWEGAGELWCGARLVARIRGGKDGVVPCPARRHGA